MTLRILIFLALGIVLGRWIPQKNLISYLDPAVTVGLSLLLFLVGMDIGKNRKLIQHLKEEGWGILLLPVSVVLGSIGGTMLSGTLLGLSLPQSGAIGAGFGWYSLSAVIIAKVDVQLGALAFLSNVFREILAVLSIPFIARRFGGMVAIAPAGATAMDTTLPVITRSAGSEMAIVAFITGVVLSALVPVLVPLLVNLM